MKKKSIYLALLFFGVSLSCDDVLDINSDPLAATKANPNAVLPFVFTKYSARKMSELGARINDVYHHFGAIFNSPAGGTISSYLKGNVWGNYYVDLLGNLKLVKDDAENTGEASNNIRAVAQIMQAQIFFELTCLFEDIPFTEALDGVKFPNPKFDSQQNVLLGLVDMLDEAMSWIDSMPEDGNFDFQSGDLLLGGDIGRWKTFANSMKIRILMLIRNVSSTKVEAEGKLVTAFGAPVISEPVFFKYPGGSGEENAYFGLIRKYFGPSNEKEQLYGPSPVMTDMMVATDDPRLELWLVDLSGTGDYPTAEYGQYPDIDEVVYADNIIRGNYPDIYFLPGELFFYKAELILSNVLSGDAKKEFESGITSTLKYWGGEIDGFQGTPTSEASIQSYIDGIGGVSLRKIHEQLWLESFFRPIIAWNTVRRTGIPALNPPGGATIKTILKRFDYPPDEIGANENIPKNKLTDVPMWFENIN